MDRAFKPLFGSVKTPRLTDSVHSPLPPPPRTCPTGGENKDGTHLGPDVSRSRPNFIVAGASRSLRSRSSVEVVGGRRVGFEPAIPERQLGLERWARGDAHPSTAGRRQAALRHAADRAETALTGLERPLDRYLIELEPERAEGRSWYGGPGAAELLEWEPVLRRAGVRVSGVRVAQAYLELAVLVRALEGLAAAARVDAAPDRSSLWAGLFDLRENLVERAAEDLRALAA